MKKTIVRALLGVLAVSGEAAAQTEGRFHTGLLSWTPTLNLRDAGIDSNVYDEPIDPKRDTSAVFSPQVEGILRLTAADVRFGGSLDFVHFQRYTSERAVNSRGNVRMDLRGWRIRPFARGSFVDARERVNSELDVRARRADREAGGGVEIQVTPRAAVEVGGSFTQSTFRQGQMFRGVDLANRLNRESVGGNARLLYEVTPLTQFVVEGAASRDQFTLSPEYDANNARASAGVEFQPDALLKGKATVGFHRIEPVGALAFGFEGVHAAVDLGYVLLQRTRFDVRVARDTSYSFEAQPYFLQTIYGGQILHTLQERFDVFGLASWETLDYPGIPERRVEADTLEVTRYGGGVVVRPAVRLRITITYELTDRQARVSADRSYDRRRVYTNVTYGF